MHAVIHILKEYMELSLQYLDCCHYTDQELHTTATWDTYSSNSYTEIKFVQYSIVNLSLFPHIHDTKAIHCHYIR